MTLRCRVSKPSDAPRRRWPERRPRALRMGNRLMRRWTHAASERPLPGRGEGLTPTRKSSSKTQKTAWKFDSDWKQYRARPRRPEAIDSAPVTGDRRSRFGESYQYLSLHRHGWAWLVSGVVCVIIGAYVVGSVTELWLKQLKEGV